MKLANLASRDESLKEAMEYPDCDPDLVRRTLQRFGAVNRCVSSWGSVYRTHVRPALAAAASVEGTSAPSRILDIGCGGGDVLSRIVRQARRDGFAVEGVGIDPDQRAFEVARAAKRASGVTYRRASSRELVAEEPRFDVVISNHLLHHLDDADFDGLIADSERLATRIAVHSDIARSRVAYAAFSVGVAPISPGTLLRADGLRSIRRSYTPTELRARLPGGWHVESPSPFRLLAVHRVVAVDGAQ